MTTAPAVIMQTARPGLTARRICALVAVPCVALSIGIGGIMAAGSGPEPTTVAGCHLPNHAYCMV